MNQITGERSKKEKRLNKGQTSTQWGNRQQRIKELLLITKEKYTESIQEEQQNKHHLTQRVRREAKDWYRRSKIVGMDSAQARHRGG